jgi:hypothetical protein
VVRSSAASDVYKRQVWVFVMIQTIIGLEIAGRIKNKIPDAR